jgi:DNA-binding Xre family transcriptional regulator
MAILKLNYTDLAKKMGVSRQMMNYIMTDGSKSYAPKLAKALNCIPYDLIITIKKGVAK